jgi:putative phosphoesterase
LKEFSSFQSPRIGLIADSHGNLQATERSIRVLRNQGADILVHLGDFCDSAQRDPIDDMIRTLQTNHVLTIKGNNDYVVELALAGTNGIKSANKDEILTFFKNIPMTRTLGKELCFAHSLPFDYLRAFYDPIDTGTTQGACRVFAETNFRILFCGHSHSPVIFRLKNKQISRKRVLAGRKMLLSTDDRHIIIVGSVDKGDCALFDSAKQIYERIKIF